MGLVLDMTGTAGFLVTWAIKVHIRTPGARRVLGKLWRFPNMAFFMDGEVGTYLSIHKNSDVRVFKTH